MDHRSPLVWEIGIVCYDSVSSLRVVGVRQGSGNASATRYGRRMASLPAAAPLPAHALLTGPVRPGRVVGVHPSCVYVVSDPGEVVAVETADGLGLPCALRLGLDRDARPFRAVAVGDPAAVGAGRVVAGPFAAEVVRWWAPPVVRRPHDRQPQWQEALEGLLRDVRPPVDPALAPHELLGRGPGLTPAGDDVLAGWLLAVHHDPDLPADLATAVEAAPATTTALSAALLREAVQGRGVPAAVALADALGGHGDIGAALDRLLRVGHTSGAALALGLLRGARLVSSRGEMSHSAPGTHQSADPDAGVAA